MLKEQLLTINKGKGRVRLLIQPLVLFIYSSSNLCTSQCKLPLWGNVGHRWGISGDLSVEQAPGACHTAVHTIVTAVTICHWYNVH